MNLLNEILDRCIAGDCDTQTACKLLGIRHESVRELIRQRRVADLAHRRLVGGFYACFPECDPRLAVTYRNAPVLKADDLLRGGPVAPCVTYTPEQAANLVPAQQRLTLGDPEESGWDRKTGAMCNNTNRRIESSPELPDAALETTGAEFQFAA